MWGMGDQQPAPGLVACDACGGAYSESRLCDNPNCPRCGNDSFTNITDPSTL